MATQLTIEEFKKRGRDGIRGVLLELEQLGEGTRCRDVTIEACRDVTCEECPFNV